MSGIARKKSLACCLVFLAGAILFAQGAKGAFAGGPFVFVAYDAKTEAELGAFPPSRAVYADMVQTLRAAGARAVVFKYFLDQAKDGPGDPLLAESFKGVDVFLQARIDDGEKKPNELDERWAIALDKTPKRLLSGKSGWLPLPDLARGARGVGFVDLRDAQAAPMYERYRGKVYPSLVLSVMRYLFPDLELQGEALRRGGRSVSLNEYGEAAVSYPARDDLRSLSYVDVVRKRVPVADLAGRIVVVGYEGPAVDMLETPIGKLSAHRVFCYFLASLYGELSGR